MPARKEYTPEFKGQEVRFVLEEIEPDESRKQACERLAPKLSMKLYNWLKQSAPAKTRPAAPPGSVEELRAMNAALRKENRELARVGRRRQAAAWCSQTPRKTPSPTGRRTRRCKLLLSSAIGELKWKIAVLANLVHAGS